MDEDAMWVTVAPNSYPYSPPSMPPTLVLQDMILAYATPETRRGLMLPNVDSEAEEMWETVMARARDLIQNWRPEIAYHVEMIDKRGRTLDYLVWRAATELNESAREIWEELPIHPWTCDIETLPRYRDMIELPLYIPGPPVDDSLPDEWERLIP